MGWVAAGKGDELVEGAGVVSHRCGRIEPGRHAAVRSEGLLRQTENVSGQSVGHDEGTIQSDGEIPTVDHEFETQDAQCKSCRQCPTGKHDIVCEPAAAPSCHDWPRDSSDALVDRIALGVRGYSGGGPDTGDGVDQMVAKSRDVPIRTGRWAVQIVGGKRLHDATRGSQRLFGTDEFVHICS